MKYICILFAVALMLTSCATSHNDSKLPPNDPFESESERLNTELVQKSFLFRKNNPASDYKIGAEDILDIDVFQIEELKKSVRVSTEGFIKLPLVGRIRASGLTTSELESEISGKLAQYVEEPVVGVFVKEYRSQQITVLGAVRNPQVYTVSGQKYLLDMLSMAGGLTDDAKNICYIQKVSEGEQDGERYVRTVVVDLDKLLLDGQADLNLPMSAGDIIHVPKGDVFFVDGAVVSPGSYQIRGTATITQALSMAKGFKYEAARRDIRVYRDNGKPERDIIAVNYNSILSGKSPDITIKDKDIIIVPKDGMKNFFKGLATTFNLGVFSVGKGF